MDRHIHISEPASCENNRQALTPTKIALGRADMIIDKLAYFVAVLARTAYLFLGYELSTGLRRAE